MFPVSSTLAPFAQDTVDRLAYLFPEISFFLTEDGIECSSETTLDLPMITQEIRYALVRQKIHADGEQNRTALYAALFQ